MSMTAIHDIVPGVGADGYMTAPIYPIGNLSNITQRLDGTSRTIDDAEREVVNDDLNGFESIEERNQILGEFSAALSRGIPIQ